MASIEKRLGNDGKSSYRVKVRLKGQPTISATFQRLTDAKKWAQDTESDIRHNRHFKYGEAKKHTLNELFQRYETAILPLKKSQRTPLGVLRWWSQEIGQYTPSNLTPAIVSQCRDKLLSEPTSKDKARSPATVVRYLALLSHVFTVAIKEWHWADTNPVLDVSKPKEPPGRVRFLNLDEIQSLLKACHESSNSTLLPIVTLALTTGMRQGEILNLQWKDIDLKNRFITILETKNNEIRRVPLSVQAVDTITLFSKVRRLDTELLFPSNVNPHKPIDIRKPWENALVKSQIENFRFHDLRHTAASYLAMNGATPIEIAEILGHKTLQMVKRYAHLSQSHTQELIEKMSSSIFE